VRTGAKRSRAFRNTGCDIKMRGVADFTNESARIWSTFVNSSGHQPKATCHPHIHIFGQNSQRLLQVAFELLCKVTLGYVLFISFSY